MSTIKICLVASKFDFRQINPNESKVHFHDTRNSYDYDVISTYSVDRTNFINMVVNIGNSIRNCRRPNKMLFDIRQFPVVMEDLDVVNYLFLNNSFIHGLVNTFSDVGEEVENLFFYLCWRDSNSGFYNKVMINI